MKLISSICSKNYGFALFVFLQYEDVKEKENSPTSTHPSKDHLVSTEFFEWCCRYFAQSVMRVPDENDPESAPHLEQEYRFMRAAKVRRDASEEQNRASKYATYYFLLVQSQAPHSPYPFTYCFVNSFFEFSDISQSIL